ncbi:MAG: hypothetical protein AB7O66_18945 [Limisphaerales bacterium]
MPRHDLRMPDLADFPQDMTSWVPRSTLLAIVEESAERASGSAWLELLGGFENVVTHAAPKDDLLILVTYCYLQGIYHSNEVVLQPDADAALVAMRPRVALRPERVRKFRRERRSTLVDCLACALFRLASLRNPGHWTEPFSCSLVRNRHNFGALEPFHIHARERLERAIVLDSMALDD